MLTMFIAYNFTLFLTALTTWAVYKGTKEQDGGYVLVALITGIITILTGWATLALAYGSHL